MKHSWKITAILLGMFLITQFIGLYVVQHYSSVRIVDGQKVNVSAPNLPYGMEPPEIENEIDFYKLFPSIIVAFIVAISLILLLSKIKAEFFIKAWFFIVVIIALGIAFNAILYDLFFSFPWLKYVSVIAVLIALPLAFIKVYRTSFFTHNFTELFIYPGIAAVFVPILNIWTVTLLLVVISVYDIWAVWRSGFMQKLAKYHINTVKIFPGFFVPHISKKTKEKIKKLKKSKSKKKKGMRFKINIAILGGGDVIFPIIASGVMLKTLGLGAALIVTVGAFLGLGYLFYISEKKKFYPAMPFITTGIFLGMLVAAGIYAF